MGQMQLPRLNYVHIYIFIASRWQFEHVSAEEDESIE